MPLGRLVPGFPPRYRAYAAPRADAWMASNASLLNVRLVATADLHEDVVPEQPVELRAGVLRVPWGEYPEPSQLGIVHVVPVLLRDAYISATLYNSVSRRSDGSTKKRTPSRPARAGS